jgi:DNA invertase Pin-like site-specific DNA recombinase
MSGCRKGDYEMTTANNIKGQNLDINEELITALYCRLSVEDIKDDKDKRRKGSEDESNSISNQKQILLDYCKKHGYKNTMFFVDDGISGTSFDRSDFNRMQKMVEEGKICRIIVKDLSRFGREQVEAGRLTQIVYPSLGVTFISIQENVNSTTGEGMEMLPFYNIFNEWYAAQTSKKIRAVWQSKADNGKRISSTVPYGYVRDEVDKEKWLIDEPAAAVVRKIFELCFAGRGPSQIARQLENERVLLPSAYYESVGRKHSQKVPLNPYNWDQSTVVHILENRQYTGCAVNFKSTTVSYKVHKVIHNPVDQQQIIPNMQEPIISEEVWLRVQELRNNRRRNTATGRTSLFSGLVFCPDCGAKLHFCASKSLKPNQEFFRCANYKDGRGSCTIHYIRNVSLEKIVLEAISDMADFIRCNEVVFLYMLAQKNKAMQKAEFERLKKTVADGTIRLGELDRLMAKLYEDNVLGRVNDEFFQKMMKNYEREQRELSTIIAEGEKVLQSTEQKTADTRLLIRTFREMTDITELTPTIVNKLIERIEVHNNDKSSGHCYVKVDIYFTGVGMISIPTEEEIIAMMESIRKNPEEYRLVA